MSESSDEGRYGRSQQPGGYRDFEGRGRSREDLGDRGHDYGRGGRGRPYEVPSKGSAFPKQPIVSSFAQGTSNILISNHFKFGLRNNGYVYMYKVDFGPNIIFTNEKVQTLTALKSDLTKIFGLHLGYGGYLFAMQEIKDEVSLSVVVGGNEHVIQIRYEQQFSIDRQDEQDPKKNMDKILHFVLQVVKRTLLDHDYKQVGRLPKFFNASLRRDIESQPFFVWPGFSCEVKCYNDGIFLNVDTATKFITKINILDKINELRKQKYSLSEIKELFAPTEQAKGLRCLTVITLYNSRTYQVSDLTFDQCPKTYEFSWILEDPVTKDRKTMKTNMVDYFLIKYNIKFNSAEENQPLLVVNIGKTTTFIPCSVCHEAQLPKDFTKDSRRMRDLQQYKISDPKERWEKIGQVVQELEIDKGASLTNWNLKINPNFAQVKSKQLYHPKVIDSEGFQKDFNDYANRAIKVLNGANMSNEKWAIIYSKDDYNRANLFLDMLDKVSRELGMKFQDPQWVEIPFIQSGNDYCVAIESDIDPKYTELAIVIVKNNTKSEPKKLLDKMGVPSQFIKADSIDRKGKTTGFIANVLRQCSAKMRMELYKLSLPKLKAAMVIGIDIVNSGRNKIIGLASTYNKNLTQYYSKILVQEQPSMEKGTRLSKDEIEERITQKRTALIGEFCKEALNQYQNKNQGNLPEIILVYRDGLGGPTLMEKAHHYETITISEIFKQYQHNYDPFLIYTFVDKNTSHRLFQKSNGDIYNPGPGTLVDSSLVEEQGERIFDYFMIAHKANVATARPVHYKVVSNNSTIPKNDLETITYHLCYGFVNYAGPIKVPAVCLYAQKIAEYAHEFGIMPNPELSDSLHYI